MNNYQALLENLKEKPPRHLNDHVLLVDSMNTFIRSFTILQSMNPQGHHTGGMVGFLRSLGYLTRTLDPTRVVCVFDGQGSSVNRKNINADYKANRNIKRITNWEIFDDKDDEYASMTMQMKRLVEYLHCLPLSLISMDKVEADDIISFIAQTYSKHGRKATIVSSDKDFLQIIDENIQVYSPIKKKIYTKENVKEELGVVPENYLIVKSLLGDSSDNLSGIKGLGLKTLLKEFNRLLDDPTSTLDYIYEESESRLKDKKIFASIIYDWDKVQTNYELMNLQEPRLTEEEIEQIKEKLVAPVPPLQSGPFVRMLEMDQIESLNKNVEGWLETFRPLTLFSKKS